MKFLPLSGRVHNLLLGYHGPELSRRTLDLSSDSFHCNLLTDFTDLQRKVERRRLIHDQRERRLLAGLEPRLARLQPEFSRTDIEKCVVPNIVRRYLPFDVGLRVGEQDFGVWNNAAGCVFHGAVD